MNLPQGAFIGLLVLIVTIGSWPASMWLASSFGWRKLANHWRCEKGVDPGPLPFRLRYASARFNLANYGGILRIAGLEEGLYLALMIFFRPFHPPLLIPWREIVAEPYQKFVVLKGYRLYFESEPTVVVELPGQTWELVMEQVKKQVQHSDGVNH